MTHNSFDSFDLAHHLARAGSTAPVKRAPRCFYRWMHVWLALILVFLVSFGVVMGVYLFVGPGLNEGERMFIVASGESIRQVALNLERESFVRSWRLVVAWERLVHSEQGYKAGVYRIPAGASVAASSTMMKEGRVFEEAVKITLPEGLTVSQIDLLMAGSGLIVEGELKRFSRTPDAYALVREFGSRADLPTKGGNYLEGFLFPDTYQFRRGDRLETFVGKMLGNFKEKWQQIVAYAGKPNRAMIDIITIASFVEREVSQADDRALVAGIIYARLSKDIPLQLDATVNYVTGKGLAAPTLEDTQTESPYNTYRFTGLPPGPISNPGLKALEATLKPRASAYLYYLSARDDGRTIFSRTYEEHLAAKRKYR